MEGKENISAELRLISKFIADIGRETPYGLPDGYFETLPGKVLDRIRTAGLVYSVPEGYFEGFADKLMSRIKAPRAEALSGEAAGAPGQDLPALEATGLSAREELAQLSPLLSQIDKKMPFQVPPTYFDAFAATLPLEDAGAESWSPLLTGLKNKTVYQAPEGYFAQLPDSILEKVKRKAQDKAAGKQAAPAKIFSLSRRNWWKYSAAAALTGLILTGGWLWTHTSMKTATGNLDITKSLPTVSDQDIESYLDSNNITNNVPFPDELANSTASLDLSDNDVKSFLGEVPDGELRQYIDEHGDEKDLATN